MRFAIGLIFGVLITIGAAYLHDSWTSGPSPDTEDGRMVNWNVVHRNVHDLGANISAEWKRLSERIQAKV
jgi:hypothetical protein